MTTNTRLNKFKDIAAKRQSGLIVVLEDIHDPHNAAAILRTCDGLGIQTVYFIFENEKAYNPKKVGKASSSSANKWLDFTVFHSTQACIAQLKKEDYTIVATALSPKAHTVFEAQLTDDKLALMVGNEHTGLSTYAVEHADKQLMIPMLGFVQSLNVSVATALILAEIIKKRNNSGKDFHLTQKEQKALITSFQNRS